MEQRRRVRVTGPSRALLILATGALVTVTSAATAFVVLQATSSVVGRAPGLAPLPPVAAAPAERPVVVLPPGALGTGRPAASAGANRVPRSTSAPRRSSSTTSSLVLSLRAPQLSAAPDGIEAVPAPDAPLGELVISGGTAAQPAAGDTAAAAPGRSDERGPKANGGRGVDKERDGEDVELRNVREPVRDESVLSPLGRDDDQDAERFLSDLLDRAATHTEKRDAATHRAAVHTAAAQARAASAAHAAEARAAGHARAAQAGAAASKNRAARMTAHAKRAALHEAEQKAAKKAKANKAHGKKASANKGHAKPHAKKPHAKKPHAKKPHAKKPHAKKAQRR